MAGPDGSSLDALTERLTTSPHGAGFFWAVRRLALELARTSRKSRRDQDDASRHQGVVPGALPGGTARPELDRLRFGQQADLCFLPSTIADLARDEPLTEQYGDDYWRMTVAFFGLLGPNGPLPWHVGEVLMARQRDRDPCLADFLNIFNHRAVSFYYRAWAENQLTVSTDRGDMERFGRIIGAPAGLDSPEMRRRGVLDEDVKLFYAGLLSLGPRPAEGLASLLSDYFGCRVEVSPFRGRWIELPRSSQCALGGGRGLGQDTVVGERVWEVRQGISLRIGPLDMRTFERLLPGGAAHEALRELVRLYAGDEWACDATLILRREEARSAQLGSFGRLGYSTWTSSGGFDEDLEDSTIPVVD